MQPQQKGPFPKGRLVDMQGWKFGKLTVLSKAGNRPDGAPLWACLCECGELTLVASGNLRNGKTNSCGCVYRLSRQFTNFKHGASRHPLYSTWLGIMKRCYDPAYSLYSKYGGQGIGVVEQWRDEVTGPHRFIEDVLREIGPRPDDQHVFNVVDPTSDFGPGNVQWLPRGKGYSKPRSRKYTHDGQTLTLKEWATRLGLAYKTLGQRVREWGDDYDRIFNPTYGGHDLPPELERVKRNPHGGQRAVFRIPIKQPVAPEAPAPAPQRPVLPDLRSDPKSGGPSQDL